MISDVQLYEFLEEKHNQYNRPSFIETDPIQIPHLFTKNKDIEIAAFLTSTIAWGQRKSIIKNARRIMEIADFSPYEFITETNFDHYNSHKNFVHRTFNSSDLLFFFKALQNIYKNHEGLQAVFEKNWQTTQNMQLTLGNFRNLFFEIGNEGHAAKHISNAGKNSACKRLNLFLMWLVRHDNRGVHFGLWKKIPSSALMLPLDVHAGNAARQLGLLTRKQNDWLAVEEVTAALRKFDANDPIKYDFALFGSSIFEKIFKQND